MKKESEIKKTILITAVLMLISFVSCGEEEIKSYWLENDIIIDGDQMDWQGKLHYLADEQSALGIANDDENLFLCLATNNTAKMFQIFVTGFTVWFEPQNGDEKIGIQYPLKSDDIKRMMQMRKRPGEGEGPDFKIRLAEFKNLQNEIRIVNKDNFPLTAYSLNNEIGIEVDVGYQMGQLVYEMRIPISKPLFGDHNLNLLPGDKVTLAFESGKFDRSDSGVREKRPGFGMGGGGGGRGRGGSGGGGSPSGRSRNSGFEQISFEVEVTLAKKSTTN